MQHPQLSLQSVLDALDLDAACMPLLEEARLPDPGSEGYTPETIYTAIRAIGNLLDAPRQAGQLAEDLEERINIVTHKLKFITEENKPRVLLLNDTDMLAAGTAGYLSRLVYLAGGIFHTYSATDTDQKPDILIIINDRPMPQLLAGLPEMLAKPQWAAAPAVVNNRIYIIHNRNHLRQPGAGIADDTEVLAEIIHPKQFIFGRDQDVWMKFDWQQLT